MKKFTEGELIAAFVEKSRKVLTEITEKKCYLGQMLFRTANDFDGKEVIIEVTRVAHRGDNCLVLDLSAKADEKVTATCEIMYHEKMT